MFLVGDLASLDVRGIQGTEFSISCTTGTCCLKITIKIESILLYQLVEKGGDLLTIKGSIDYEVACRL